MLKNKKSLRFSEKELGQLLQDNKNIKCNITDLTLMTESTPVLSKKNKKAKLSVHSSEEKPIKERNTDIDSYLSKIKSCTTFVLDSADVLYLEFNGLKLMPFNQLAQVIQYRPHTLYQYKKALKQLIHIMCIEHQIKFKVTENESIQLLLFREAERLIDNDTMSISFKYIIDNLRYENIITEDNPTIIKDIQCFQNKSKTPKTALILKKVKGVNHLTPLESFKKLTELI